MTPSAFRAETYTPVGMVILYDHTLAADGTFDTGVFSTSYRNLTVQASIRATHAATIEDLRIRFNGDSTTNNYASAQLYNNDASVAGVSYHNGYTNIYVKVPGASVDADWFGVLTFDIPNYAGSQKKSIAGRFGYPRTGMTAAVDQGSFTGFYNSTSPINRIQMEGGNTANLKAGSRLTVYGIGGIPAVLAPGTQLAYSEITSNVTVSASSSASPTQVVSSGAVTYAAERICVEFYASIIEPASGDFINLVLYDDTTQLGDIGGIALAGSARNQAVLVRRFLTPTPGSHTYKMTAYRGSSNGTIYANTGVSGQYMPSYIRVTAA